MKTTTNFSYFDKLLIAIFFLFIDNSFAQCAMCRASLEGEGNAQKAEAVNSGIVYLMSFPYILAAVMGYVIYRMYAKRKKMQS